MAKVTLRTSWLLRGPAKLMRDLITAFGSLNDMFTELYASITDVSTTMQTSAPATGATVVCTDTNDTAHLVLTPAGTIATLTVTLPTNANSSIGQRVTISSSAGVSTMTVSGAGLTVTPATVHVPTGGAITYQKVAANAWRQISTHISTTMQTSAPADAATVVCTDASNNAHLVLTPAGTIATATVTLPTDANSNLGQRVTISSSAEITAMTVSGAGLTVVPATLVLPAGAAVTYQKVATNVWRQLGAGNEKEEVISIPIGLHASKVAYNLLTARRALRVLNIDYTPDIAQGGALTGTVVKATGTATPASATTPMHTAGGIDLNGTAHTVQPITLSVTAADLALVAGERIGFVESGAMSVGSGTISIRVRYL